jgi:excisionase family DNA binding protein
VPVVTSEASESPMLPMLVSIEKAAHLLGVAPRTVYRMLADHELPYVKVGRRTLLSVGSLESWIAAHEIPAEMVGAA